MEIKVINPNDYIRNLIASFLGVEEDFEENLVVILNYLEALKYNNYDKYEKIIAVMYTSFWLLESFDLFKIEKDEENEYEWSVGDFLEFSSAKDVVNYIERVPELLNEIISQTIEFNDMYPLEKRNCLIVDSETLKYIRNINPYYIFDKIEYCREYDKDYLFYLYKEKVIKAISMNKEIQSLKLVAKEQIKDFLENLREYDIYNYDSLVISIMRDFYLLEKYNLINNQCTKSNRILVSRIERTSLDNLIDLTNKDFYFLPDIISSFVELNEKSLEEQEKIISVALSKTKEHVKRKMLIKP